MGIFSKDIKTFGDLVVHTLRDLYYAENQNVSVAGDGREGGRWPAEEGVRNTAQRDEEPRRAAGARLRASRSSVDRPPIV
jgi:hypothetical protein